MVDDFLGTLLFHILVPRSYIPDPTTDFWIRCIDNLDWQWYYHLHERRWYRYPLGGVIIKYDRTFNELPENYQVLVYEWLFNG